MPRAAMPQIMPKITQPRAVFCSLIVQREIGVYVPAISRYTEQWSITRNTFFARSSACRPWYMLDIVYRTIIIAP